MTTPRLDPGEVYDLAAQLVAPHAEIDDDAWTDCASARYRSTISRAYYSAFLSLKAALIDSKKLPGGFPTHDAHSRLFHAVMKSGVSRRLADKLRKLKSLRVDADYDLEMEVDLGVAETCLDDAEDAATIIDNLDSVSLSKIARNL